MQDAAADYVSCQKSRMTHTLKPKQKQVITTLQQVYFLKSCSSEKLVRSSACVYQYLKQ